MQGSLSLRERLLVLLAAALLPLAVAIVSILARAQRPATDFAAFALLVAADAAAVWWIGRRIILKPVKQILGAVKRLEQGRLDARVPVQGARGEFARMAAAFNLMADSLQVRQAGLEAELERSRGAYAVLDQVLNSMQEGVIAVTAEGRFLMHNDAAARMFPMQDAPVLPALWPEHFGFFHADGTTPYKAEDLPFVLSALGLSGSQQQVFVRNALAPEGRVLQCSWQPLQGGSVRGGLVVFTDVTELHKLQSEQGAQFARLADTQRKLVEAQRIGRVGNWELDLRTGRLWWSDEVFALFGISRDDFDGTIQGFEQHVHPDDRAQLKPARDRALRDGLPMSVDYRIVRPDGAIVWIQELAETRRDDSGEPVWFGGLVQDVTQRKQQAIENAQLLEQVRELNAGLESRIAQRTEQLRGSNEELEAFSYSVSHDLRAPLGAIAGFSRALEGKLQGAIDEKAMHYLQRIQAGVGKMEQLIDAMLQLSRVVRAPLEWRQVNLTAIAHDAVEGLRMQDPSRRVQVAIADGLRANGDDRLLRLVVENLVGNAWKFTSRGLDARIDVGRAADDAFYVRDNGVGFDMAHASKLFTAFHRLHTEAEFPGTGIGLATVRRIIARHEGRVWVESVPGGGTTFYFSLPDEAPRPA